MTMADTVAVMNAGRLEQVGAPADLYDHPASTFVANFLGQSNLLTSRITGHGTDGMLTADCHGQPILVAADHVPSGIADVFVGVRPEKLRIGHQGSNRLSGTVTDASFAGVATQYLVRMPWGFELTVVQPNDGSPRARVGEKVDISWDPGSEFVLDATQDEDAGLLDAGLQHA